MSLLYERPYERYPDRYCWCGWSRADALVNAAEHYKHHRLMDGGLYAGDAALRSGVAVSGYSVVPCTANQGARERVYHLMRAFRVYMGFDFVQWPATRVLPAQAMWVDERLMAVVHTFPRDGGTDERGAATIDAWMLLHRVPSVWRIDAESRRNLSGEDGEDGEAWSVAAIYVTNSAQSDAGFLHRREGRARGLLDAAARHVGIKPHEFSWGMPLSHDGWALAVSVAGGGPVAVSA